MRLFNQVTAVVLIFSLTLLSCQKELSFTKTNSSYENQLIKLHETKVETWIKLMPIVGKLESSTEIITKTINQNGQLITRMQVGDKGSSLVFISKDKVFHVYGLYTKNLNANHSGTVEIFDFQSLQKKGIRYSDGKLFSILKYPNVDIFNAYLNKYPVDEFRSKKQTSTVVPTVSSITGGPGILSVLRKFFCELFGGYWAGSIAENGGANGSCYTSSNGEDVVQNVQMDPNGGGTNWGLIYPNINNVDFFDFSSRMWADIIAGLNAGSTNLNWAITTPVNFIDQECTDPDRIRALFFTLNTKYNQGPASLEFGTLDETFEEFKNYKDQEQVLIPIIPWLIKAGANGAADALMQALFINLTEDDCPSFGAAFGHDKFSKTQVARSAAEGLIPWRTPGGKLGRAAFTAVGDVMVNLIDGKYGENNYQAMGYDFMLGFFSDLAGGAAGELASKYSLQNIGKGLLNKYGINYKTVTSWLGGGLQLINKSFTHNGKTITASRVMKGFAENKIAVIGRSMNTRVIPFANNLSNELGVPVLTWPGFNSALSVDQNVANNRTWIKSLKEQGYTFYDIGLDPGFTSGQLNGGIPDFTEGDYYKMELDEIIR